MSDAPFVDDEIRRQREKRSTGHVVDLADFPHVRTNRDGRPSSPLPTVENLAAVLSEFGVKVAYNQITKAVQIDGPGIIGNGRNDGEQDAAIEHVCNLAARHRMGTTQIPGQLGMLALRNQVNPVVAFLDALSPAGEGHIKRLAGLVETHQPEARDIAFRRFLIQACAAADGAAQTPNTRALPKFEYVLVLRSAQGAQKTIFFSEMVPPDLRSCFKESAYLDPQQKDSVEAAIGHWIVELGELDATFRKADLSRLKAFLSDRADVFRKTYGRAHNRYQRRTVFCGSVNNEVFLRDTTGNRRYWVIGVDAITRIADSGIDVCAAWAEAWTAYKAGEQWWPLADEEKVLQAARGAFEELEAHPIAEKLSQTFNLSEGNKAAGSRRMTATEIANAIGYAEPTRGELDILVGWLERHNLDRHGRPDVVLSKGARRWRMPGAAPAARPAEWNEY